ncbi:hypothetical protein XELAEV_18035531mg [Xenopus laevis]|uniref:Uncharacterized protein n=1 Tax=Xenopus laevis TaxID=8355 RepID=A0A974CI21_XENLA|nr:hypothetical protein XELAEV_18035531mg [Xenopus laevis]
MEKTLRNEPGIFDWTTVIQAVCDMEGKGTTEEEKREKLKKTVTKTMKCDVTKSNPVAPLMLPRVDCIMAIACLESACKDLDSYCNALKNISSLLKDFMRSDITNTGYAIIDLEVLARKYDKEQYNICDHDSTIFVLACKLRDI